MSAVSMKIVEENGVKLRVSLEHQTPEKSDVFFNPKIKINRELVLCGLSVFLDQHKEYAVNPARCLDAFSASGALGLQWQKHLKSQKQVTLNDIKPTAVQNIHFNCKQNNMDICTFDDMVTSVISLSPNKESCRPPEGNDGDHKGHDWTSSGVTRRGKSESVTMEDVTTTRKSDGVEVVCQDANVLLLQRAFDFIHLDPFGTSVHHLESAFRNTPNKGIVSITSTDLASVYGRCPKMTKRHYSANVRRTEYYRELATRVILGAVARAAARCNKGLEVLLSVAYEHFILVMVRVVRGPRHADHSVDKVQQVIHCLICSERCFVPGNHSVESDYYKLLKCKCKQNSAGKTAVFLGPVWSGSIFKAEFIQKMLQCAIRLKLNTKLLETLHSEAVCSKTMASVSITCKAETADKRALTKSLLEDSLTSTATSTCVSSDIIQSSLTSEKTNSLQEAIKHNKRSFSKSLGEESSTSTSTSADIVKSSIEEKTNRPRVGNHQVCAKRQFEGASSKEEFSQEEIPPAKRLCKESNDEMLGPAPSFYYNIHVHTAKGNNALKLKKVIQLLKENGYRASRTHFDPVAVRTDANIHEFLDILTSNSLPTSKPTV